MNKYLKVIRRHRALGIGCLLVTGLLLFAKATNAEAPAPLSANDVSILFPVPKSADMSGFLSVAELTGSDGLRLLSDKAFEQFIAVAESDSEIIDKDNVATRIEFPPATKDVKAWFVAGIRLDLGAPGLSADVQQKFGQLPQIRLILQPVTQGTGEVPKVHDRAAHLIFSFVKPELAPPQEKCSIARMVPRLDADLDSFRPLIADFVALRDDLKAGAFGEAVDTSGSLKVHPGLSGSTQKLMRDRLKKILQKHLKASQLTALAVMGLPMEDPEPWIFVAMQRDKSKDTIASFPSPALDGRAKAQLLRFFGSEHVVPMPRTDNQSPITTCFRMPDTRVGVATAELLSDTTTSDRLTEVTGTIADPVKSHFFNTDCVSCHTETRLVREVTGTEIPGVDEAVLPKTTWNVRNFGWGSEFGRIKATITRRTATETEEVVMAINKL
jgi:hypothetical protein